MMIYFTDEKGSTTEWGKKSEKNHTAIFGGGVIALTESTAREREKVGAPACMRRTQQLRALSSRR